MKSPGPKNIPPDHPGGSPEEQALHDAVAGLMSALARLAVARGLPYAVVDEMLKRAFVQAADAAHPGLLPHRKVSRVSTATGINRREVTRLMQPEADTTRPRGRSLAAEVFTHWRTQRPYRTAAGEPRQLPRQGPEPSFESLAQAVTRDVHPRSLLDELCRLGMATWDQDSDTVALSFEVFVPKGDRVRMLGFLGDNVGDHLRAAVANVLGEDPVQFEQAVFADGLSLASIESVRPAIAAQWQALLAALVPALEARVAADAQTQPPPQGRLRVGLYTYHEAGPPALSDGAAAPPRPRRAPKEDSE
jgi:Family of unknown function (DUF6502)